VKKTKVPTEQHRDFAETSYRQTRKERGMDTLELFQKRWAGEKIFGLKPKVPVQPTISKYIESKKQRSNDDKQTICHEPKVANTLT